MSGSTVNDINISMPCVDNKDLIYNVKELPETFSIQTGDMLLVETDDGTNIMDFNNFVIGLDNTTFGTTITQHSTDINTLYSEFDTLSAAVDASVAQVTSNTTKALISLSAMDEHGAQLVSGSNIQSVEVQGDVIRFNFTTNFTSAAYLVLPAAASYNGKSELVQLIESEKQTNYLDLQAVDISTKTTATSAVTLGFTLEVL